MASPVPILFWNNTVFALSDGNLEQHALAEGGDKIGEFIHFIQTITPAPKAMRLFCAMPNLEATQVACPPKTGRAGLKKIHASNYPNISNPEIAWGIMPPRKPGAPSTATLLFVEQQPFLLNLVRALKAAKINIAGVFPMASLVEAIEQASDSDRPLIAFGYTDSDMFVYSASPDSTRFIEFFDAKADPERIQRELSNPMSRFENANPVYLVINAGAEARDFDFPTTPERTLSIAEVLEFGAACKPGPTANLLQPESILSADLIGKLAAVVILVIAAVLFASYGAELRQAGADRHALALQENETRQAVASLQQNETVIRDLRNAIEEATPAKPCKAKLLDELARDRAHEITIRNINMTEAAFTVSGILHAGSTSLVTALADRLNKSDLWRVELELKPTSKDAPTEFTLNGKIK